MLRPSIFLYIEFTQKYMIVRRQQPTRPFSRLDNFCFGNNQPVCAVGIPQKLMSASKPFPHFSESDQEKQNALVKAPKKQEKINSKRIDKENAHVFRRRVQSDIPVVDKKIENKLGGRNVFRTVLQNKSNVQKTVAEHIQVHIEQSNPFSQALKNEEVEQKKKGGIVQEKSFARRVKERIEAQNAKREGKKRKNSIGEEAYLPFDLKQLREKISLRNRKSSQDYATAQTCKFDPIFY